MPYQEPTHDTRAAEFIRQSELLTPSCPHLSLASYDDILVRSSQRPLQFSQPTLLPYIARLRASFHSTSREPSIRLHDAIAACSAAAATRYQYAQRPARTHLCALLSDGLLSIARSGVVEYPLLTASLRPVFPDSSEISDPLLALEVLSGAIRGLSHFADPILGLSLAQAHVNLFHVIRRLDDDLLQDVLAPSILPLLAVSASTVFSPGTSVVAPHIAPHVPSLETTSSCGLVSITTHYAPSLTTSVVFPSPNHTRVRLDRDSFNSFASLFLLPAASPSRSLNLFRFHAIPLKGKHPIHIAGKAFRLDPAVVRSLQEALNSHMSHPTHVAWSNYRAAQMGDF